MGKTQPKIQRIHIQQRIHDENEMRRLRNIPTQHHRRRRPKLMDGTNAIRQILQKMHTLHMRINGKEELHMNQELSGTKFNYGCILYETDKWIVELLEKINSEIADHFHKALHSKTCFDILDLDDDAEEAHCILEFNRRTGEDEDEAINTVKEILDETPGVNYSFDDYPNIDEDSCSSYSYSFKICKN